MGKRSRRVVCNSVLSYDTDMADDETTETETETETTETEETETVAPASDDEPPAWFKKHLEAEAAKKTTKTVTKPTKTTPPVKKAAPAAKTDTSEEPAKKKRSGVSRSWFGSRAEE